MKVTIESNTGTPKYQFIDDNDDNTSEGSGGDNDRFNNATHIGTIKRYDLDVEYEVKDIYKKLGCRWDANAKTWYWMGQRSKMPHAIRIKLKL